MTFAQWIRGRRDEGIDLRLCALEPHVHHLLEDVGEAGDALMPVAQATDTTPRRRVDTHLEAPKASSSNGSLGRSETSSRALPSPTTQSPSTQVPTR